MGKPESPKRGCACSLRHCKSLQRGKNVSAQRSCIRLRETYCCNSLPTTTLRRNIASSTPLTSLATNKPSPLNYDLPPASPASGSSKASRPKRGRCSRRSTAGSPRALTRPTSRRPRRSLWSCSNNRGTGADDMERQEHDGRFHHTTRHYGPGDKATHSTLACVVEQSVRDVRRFFSPQVGDEQDYRKMACTGVP